MTSIPPRREDAMRADPDTAVRHASPDAGAGWSEIRPAEIGGRAAAALPGETLCLQVAAEAAGEAIRAVLASGRLLLLRTQRRDDGSMRITAIRPERL
ncbi:MAG: hypothetical protein J0M02_08330 [Planctomycetes bacterium]|nr:hypothetical protein [Planctomycetota bacterium]